MEIQPVIMQGRDIDIELMDGKRLTWVVESTDSGYKFMEAVKELGVIQLDTKYRKNQQALRDAGIDFIAGQIIYIPYHFVKMVRW